MTAIPQGFVLQHHHEDYMMNKLKKLDIGYQYTADNGKSYPFRGKGLV
ncbi:hypothetical protein [Bacillus sp. Bva_UNVM-123]